MKVKIKMNVPKPPTGISGITFFGSCYKWKDVFYRMGEEYTVKKEDFNPAIMVNLTPRKSKVPLIPISKTLMVKVEKDGTLKPTTDATEAIGLTEEDDPIVELNTSDEVPTEIPDEVEIHTEETPSPPGEGDKAVGELSEKFEASAKERKHRKK